MDEAMGMGQGTYFQKHGYRDRLELMREHMDRVMEICGRYDVEPMIWSDMYLRSVCGESTMEPRGWKLLQTN